MADLDVPDATSGTDRSKDTQPSAARTSSPAAPSPLPAPISALAALESPNFRRFWLGAFISHIGFWIRIIPKDWLLLELTNDNERWLGYDNFALGMAVVVMLPLGGVIADRYGRRNVPLWVYSLSGLMWGAIAWLVAAGTIEAWHLVLASAVSGILEGVRIPTYWSIIPVLVRRDNISNAIALNSVQFQATRIVGPLLAGWVYLAFGAAECFAVFFVGCVAMVVLLLFVRDLPTGRGKPREPVFRSIAAGVAYVRQRPHLHLLLLMVVLTGWFSAPMLTMLASLAKEGFGKPAAAYANLMTAFGVGACIGALVLAVHDGRSPTPWRVFPLLMLMGGVQIAIGFSENYALTLGLVALSGLMFTSAMVHLNTCMQTTIAEEVRGRMMSIHQLAVRMGVPIGSLLAGFLAQSAGIHRTFLIFGLGVWVIMPLVLWGLRMTGHDKHGRSQPETEAPE